MARRSMKVGVPIFLCTDDEPKVIESRIALLGEFMQISRCRFSLFWTLQMCAEACLAGAGMFGAYYATMRLYSITDIATAEFPTLLSSLIIQPFEAVFLQTPMQLPYFLSTLVFIFIICYILVLQNRSEAPGYG